MDITSTTVADFPAAQDAEDMDKDRDGKDKDGKDKDGKDKDGKENATPSPPAHETPTTPSSLKKDMKAGQQDDGVCCSFYFIIR